MDGLSIALERLVRRSEGAVRGIGVRHGLGEAEIDELFQDVRIRLWKARQEADELEELSSSYVYRTATSAALDMIRRRRRGPAQVPLNEGLLSPPSEHPEHEMDRRDLRKDLESAIEGLPERRRPVVRMHLAGYGRHEIAELLGWTEAKTRNLLYRGMADLRASLNKGKGPSTGVALPETG